MGVIRSPNAKTLRRMTTYFNFVHAEPQAALTQIAEVGNCLFHNAF